MIRSTPSRDSGYLLSEMLIVMMALGAGMALGGAALILALQTQRTADQTFQKLVQRRALAEQFRGDVHWATSTLPAWLDQDEVASSPTCLILQGPGTEKVIYRWVSGQLERIEIKDNQASWRPLPVGPGVIGLELTPHPERGVITMKLLEAGPKGGAERYFELSAALGGDWR